MGANTIRIYGWDNSVRSGVSGARNPESLCTQVDHTEFLDELYRNELMILVTYYLGTAEQNPVYTPDQRWGIIGGFLEQVGSRC
jgi:hypothetical protein